MNNKRNRDVKEEKEHVPNLKQGGVGGIKMAAARDQILPQRASLYMME